MSYNLYLNTTPCQFSYSKTKKGIKYITDLLASRCFPNSRNGIHHFTIILSNNSLLEGRQWNIRLKENNIINKVAIISSDKNSASWSSAQNFLGYCVQLSKPDNLPDVIVVCNNTVRNEDILSIIKTFNNKIIDLSHIGIHNCIFTIMFDEADEPNNLTNASNFLLNIDDFNIIESVHLITATPYDKFWKKLRQNNNINSIKNINNVLCDEMPCPDEMISLYRKIEDHNIIHVENPYKNQVDYIKYVYENKINKNESIRLLCPPNRYKNSHEISKEYFLSQNFIVVIINSNEKIIYFNDNEKVTIDKFNIDYRLCKKNSDVEIYKTLSKLNELYKNRNIAIIGFTCILRGITFQTDGFNFTDVIIPNIKDKSSAIQVLGRCNGGKQFVKPHNIYISKEMYDEIKDTIKFSLDLVKSNPEEIKDTDFREITLKEKERVRWCIPEIINLTEGEYKSLTERNGIQFKKPLIKDFISQKINIDSYDLGPVMEPRKDNTYNKNISTILSSYNKNEAICLLKKKDKERNIKLYSVYFDYKNEDIIIIKYNGDISLW